MAAAGKLRATIVRMEDVAPLDELEMKKLITSDGTPCASDEEGFSAGHRLVESPSSPESLITGVLDASRMSDISTCSTSSRGRVLRVGIFLPNKLMIDLEVTPKSTAKEMFEMAVEEQELPSEALEVFALWMVSPLLEIQLKPHHIPMRVRKQWIDLLEKYTSVGLEEMEADEPILSFQRNVFYQKHKEMKIMNDGILELLYEEAKCNIVDGRYPLEHMDYETLAGYQARIDLGPYCEETHITEYFRTRLHDFVPEHICRTSNWSWFNFRTWGGWEQRIIDQFKNVPAQTSMLKLHRRYLEFCWALPYYGSAFFHGQIERPASRFSAFLNNYDLTVIVAINKEGVYIIDPQQCTLLLGLHYEEFNWDYSPSSDPDNPSCLPCLFLQFQIEENDDMITKLFQIFSRQAVMMDALITSCVEELKKSGLNGYDAVETYMSLYGGFGVKGEILLPMSATLSQKDKTDSCLSNKFQRLKLITYTGPETPLEETDET